MKFVRLGLENIRSFKSLWLDLEKTHVLIGQNDHGKSSILKVLDIVFNRITDEMIDQGLVSPDIGQKLLTVFSTNAKARRITIVYEDSSVEKELYLTIRPDLTLVVHDIIKRGSTDTLKAANEFKKLRQSNRYVLVPALRDTSSEQYLDLLANTLETHGLSRLMPKRAGGTTKEYRQLKAISDDIQKKIKPFLDQALLPRLQKSFGFELEHPFSLSVSITAQSISDWIRSNLQLAFQLGDSSRDEDASLPLSEAGTGVQSAVLLALHQLDNLASQRSDVNFVFAIEEPESFLHPQNQRELYENIKTILGSNSRAIITTHSPFIVSETKFDSIGIVKKDGKFSSLHTPAILNETELDIFDSYSNEINSVLFFAEKVVLVEGESDSLVLRSLLQKKYGSKAHRITIISAAGNKSFSPYMRMIRCWENAKIPFIVVTDFDSLTSNGQRAVFEGVQAAGFTLPEKAKQELYQSVNSVIDAGPANYEQVARDASEFFEKLGAKVFVFTGDLEYALITDSNKEHVTKILNQHKKEKGENYAGHGLDQLRRLIGSKGIPLNPNQNPKFKKPHIHKQIIDDCPLDEISDDLKRVLDEIGALGS